MVGTVRAGTAGRLPELLIIRPLSPETPPTQLTRTYDVSDLVGGDRV